MIFKIAILQTRLENVCIIKNVDRIIETMKEASRSNADILLLPECFVTGYRSYDTSSKEISLLRYELI